MQRNVSWAALDMLLDGRRALGIEVPGGRHSGDEDGGATEGKKRKTAQRRLLEEPEAEEPVLFTHSGLSGIYKRSGGRDLPV